MFVPGSVIKTFVSKKGNPVVLRLPKEDDASLMLAYINELSKEDTFINFGGEQLTIDEETKYLNDVLEKMQSGNAVQILALVNERLVGIAGAFRLERRSRHVGSFGISIKKEDRGEGIGRAMMDELIILATTKMGLIMLQLSVFSENKIACALYQSFGFREVGRIPKKLAYREKLLDEIVMVKEL